MRDGSRRTSTTCPGSVIAHIATQVGVSPDGSLQYEQYEWSGRTIEYHRAQIRGALGFREATVEDGTGGEPSAGHVTE